MDQSRYFDHAATSPVDPRVLREMAPYLEGECGNAHSIHSWGRAAMAAVEKARERVAEMLGLEDPSEIVFTSGATESNNWALAQGLVACSPFEHSSVLEPVRARQGEVLGNDGYVIHAPIGAVDLLAVMAVNNETGAILEPPPSTRLLRDLTQAAGKMDVSGLDYDLGSLSSHKICGPKGVGALVIRGGPTLEPLMRGGGHEAGRRAGTLNVPGIVGFGAAAAIACEEMAADLARAEACRAAVMDALQASSHWQENRAPSQSPFILSMSFEGLEGETLVIEADGQGYAISAGAACSSGTTERSHVLAALGVEESWRRGTVRISFGRGNTPEAATGLGCALAQAVDRLRGA